MRKLLLSSSPSIRLLSFSKWLAFVTCLAMPYWSQPVQAQEAQQSPVSAGAERLVFQFLRAKMREAAPEIGKLALARARRAFVLGPFVSGAGAVSFDGDFDGSIGGGIAFTKFSIPIFPSKRALVERIKSKFIKAMLARMAGKGTSDEEVRKVAEEVWLEIKADLLLDLTPKRFEKPGLAGRLEVNRLFDAKVWDVRLMGAIGISRVFVGTGLVIRLDDDPVLAIPLELSLPMTLTKGSRSPLLDFFARVDLVVAGEGVVENQALFGARAVLDVI